MVSHEKQQITCNCGHIYEYTIADNGTEVSIFKPGSKGSVPLNICPHCRFPLAYLKLRILNLEPEQHAHHTV